MMASVKMRSARLGGLLTVARRSRISAKALCSAQARPERVSVTSLRPGVFEVTVAQSLPLGGRLVVQLPNETNVTVLLVQTAAGLRAVTNRCSHLGGDLSSGSIRGCVLVCPSHGWRFDLRAGRAPKLGSSGPASRALEAWDVIEGDGCIVLAAPPSWSSLHSNGYGRAVAES
jgi:nitrite reductase/ring-hydroxylating ferredoxin subunit